MTDEDHKPVRVTLDSDTLAWLVLHCEVIVQHPKAYNEDMALLRFAVNAGKQALMQVGAWSEVEDVWRD